MSEKPDVTMLTHPLSVAFRDFVLKAPRDDLDDALRTEGEDPETLLAEGKNTIQKAFAQHHALPDMKRVYVAEIEKDSRIHITFCPATGDPGTLCGLWPASVLKVPDGAQITCQDCLDIFSNRENNEGIWE